MTNFQKVAAMNEAFGNPKGGAIVSLERIKQQAANIPDEVAELFIALGADPVSALHGAGILKNAIMSATTSPDQIVTDDVRDAACDINVFSYGIHHLMGEDADADMGEVIDGVMSRFVKDPEDLENTLKKLAKAGVSNVEISGEYPEMIVRSGLNQPDAPKGKFMKSVSYRKPNFTKPKFTFSE